MSAQFGLYKAKRVDNDEWIHGFYFKSKDGHFIKYETYDEGFVTYKINPLTVCAYIGKLDSEGKEVFIGDVVADLNDPHVGLGVITWNEETASVHIVFDDEYAPVGYLPEVLVVGNIHDPEYSKIMPECLRKDPPAPAFPVKPLPKLKVIKGDKK